MMRAEMRMSRRAEVGWSRRHHLPRRAAAVDAPPLLLLDAHTRTHVPRLDESHQQHQQQRQPDVSGAGSLSAAPPAPPPPATPAARSRASARRSSITQLHQQQQRQQPRGRGSDDGSDNDDAAEGARSAAAPPSRGARQDSLLSETEGSEQTLTSLASRFTRATDASGADRKSVV